MLLMSVPNICLYEKTEESHPRIPFTLKAQCKIVADNILIFLILFLGKKIRLDSAFESSTSRQFTRNIKPFFLKNKKK